MPRKSTRRQFLLGAAARDAVEDVLDLGVPSPSQAPPPPAAPNYLLEVGRRAMACDFHIYLNAGQHPQSTDHAVAALDLIDRLEDQLSVYRDHSELSRVNRQANAQPMPVEGRLFHLLKLSLDLHRQTQGAFDITAGPISKLWGFYRRAGRMPSDEEVSEVLHNVGSQFVVLNDAEQSVRLERPGMEFNLGGIGKGYALDRCAELLVENGVADFLIHGGLSSVLARGKRGVGTSQERGWSIALCHPLKDDVRLGEIWLCDRALGTSGTAHQFFYHEGKRYAHILDPRTARPAEGMLSTTVLAPTAALADALATAFFVLGVEASREYCHQNPEIAAILITPGQRSGALGIHTLNMTDDVWQPWSQ